MEVDGGLRNTTPIETTQRLGRVGRIDIGAYKHVPRAGTGRANRIDNDCAMEVFLKREGSKNGNSLLEYTQISKLENI